MLFTLNEIGDIVLISLIMGYMFKDVFVRQRHHSESYDPIKAYTSFTSGSAYDNFVLAVTVTAPAIILHELGHKFVAMSFGAAATFKAAYFFLGLGLIMKLMNFGFVFFVPAYVEWTGVVTHFQAGMIAFAGPAVNLVLWLGSLAWLKYGKPKGRYIQILTLTKQINMFLFIFNILPIPGFDGYHVFMGFVRAFLGS